MDSQQALLLNRMWTDSRGWRGVKLEASKDGAANEEGLAEEQVRGAGRVWADARTPIWRSHAGRWTPGPGLSAGNVH